MRHSDRQWLGERSRSQAADCSGSFFARLLRVRIDKDPFPCQNGAFHLLAGFFVRSRLHLSNSETQLFQRLAAHLIAQMSIVLLDHLDRGARYLSNGQKINTLMNKVRDG